MLDDIVKELGVSQSTGDALWVIDFANGSAQVGSNYIEKDRFILLGDEGGLKVSLTE